ncbi:hypothetical protein Tco_0752146 [Tanacetum coccineum]|uniref:Uncharacterized protein n=1 Tax=Tanacetum coccineum TaxID=301880 RepID=A0ABQ4Z654_9ASTR
MAQQQQAADVHPDELCPPNKRYDLIDANKKVDLENVQCPSESKILMNIFTNHPLRFSIVASASVPWIYMAQFWHTLKEDGSKHRFKFLLDRIELTLTLDDFRTIFHFLQANDNNNASFVQPPSFSDMVPFYKQVLGFTMDLKTVSNLKITGLQQPWQTLCKIFSQKKQEQGWDAGYHHGMITDRMKLTEQYKIKHEVFGLDVPLTQSQPTESTQGMHRTTSAPRSPNPATEPAESTEKADGIIIQDMFQEVLLSKKRPGRTRSREIVALVSITLAAEGD